MRGVSPYTWLPLCSSHSPALLLYLDLLSRPHQRSGVAHTAATAGDGPSRLSCSYCSHPLCGIGPPALLRHPSCFCGATSLTPYFLALLPCVLPAAALHQDSRASWEAPSIHVSSSRCVCNTNTTPEDPQTCCPGCKSVYLLLLAQLVTSRPPALPWPSYLCPLHQMG